jgi:hypothetical protein
MQKNFNILDNTYREEMIFILICKTAPTFRPPPPYPPLRPVAKFGMPMRPAGGKWLCTPDIESKKKNEIETLRPSVKNRGKN